MKTAILELETHDDLVSIRDKIEWCKSQRIILVYPKRVKRIPSELDLRLIKRSAEMKGASAAIVTRDNLIIENADEVGIPVFVSIPKAERGNWTKYSRSLEKGKTLKGINAILDEREHIPEDARPSQLNPAARIFFFLLALAALASLAVFIIPSAVIRVYPETKSQSLTLDVTASTEVDGINITGMISASEITFKLKLEQTTMSTGSAGLPQSKASGIFLVNNLTNESLSLPKGAVFSTTTETPLRFTSLAAVELPAGTEGVEVEVEALVDGDEGNIAAGSMLVAEGIYGSMVEISNSEPFTGGSSSILPAPSDEDYENLKGKMILELKQMAKDYLEQQENDFEKMIPESLEVEKIISETRLNTVGEPSDSLTLELEVQYRALAYDPQDIAELMHMILNANLEKDCHSVGTQVELENTSAVRITGSNAAQWQVRGTRPIVRDWNINLVSAAIKGKTINEAIDILDKQVAHLKSAEISTTPRFWKRLPLLPNRINFEEVFTP